MDRSLTPNAPDSIRRASTADVATLARLGRDTFHETWIEGYRMPYSPDAVADLLDRDFAPDVLEARLADPAHALWLLEREGVPLGYAHAGPCTLPYPEVTPADGELKRVYVRRAAQGSGAGAALLLAALAWLDRAGPRRIWLGVWSGNTGAQRLYARHGFTKFGEHTYPVGDVVDREFAMTRG